MPEEIHEQNGQPEHPSVRFEHSDASFRSILSIILGSALVIALLYWCVWKFFLETRGELRDLRRSPFPLAQLPSDKLPPEPRLEQLDRLARDMESNVYVRQRLREAILSRYGPTREKDYVHVPVAQAMQYLAKVKKLPARQHKAEGTPRDNGLVDHGESNSGQVLRKRVPPWLAR